MKALELCYFCGKSDHEGPIVPWFVQTDRLNVHMACFLAAYERERQPLPQRLAA